MMFDDFEFGKRDDVTHIFINGNNVQFSNIWMGGRTPSVIV